MVTESFTDKGFDVTTFHGPFATEPLAQVFCDRLGEREPDHQVMAWPMVEPAKWNEP